MFYVITKKDRGFNYDRGPLSTPKFLLYFQEAIMGFQWIVNTISKKKKEEEEKMQ